MCSKKGYSIAICGFLQTSHLLRFQFTSLLSLNSPCGKLLKRISYAWMFVFLMVLILPLAATGIKLKTTSMVTAPVSCILMDSTVLRNRLFPTIQSVIGVAEFIFGNAMGCMTSQRSDCTDPNASSFIFGPQLEGSIGMANSIIGPGYNLQIESNCRCQNFSDPASLTSANLLNTWDISNILNQIETSTTLFIYMSTTSDGALNATTLADPSSAVFTTTMGNTNYCGGFNQIILPVCLNTFSNASNINVAATFATDGTPASIAVVDQREYQGSSLPQTVTVSQMFTAFRNIMSPGTVYVLPSIVPGMLNPLTWWQTSNLMSIDPALLSSGMGTMISMILRGGIQRSFDNVGSNCDGLLLERKDQTILQIQYWSFLTILLIDLFQLTVCVAVLSLSGIWFYEGTVITPAIKAISDPVYLIALLSESPFMDMVRGTVNSQRHVIWQSLDVVVRIGESLDIIDENIGKIRMDR